MIGTALLAGCATSHLSSPASASLPGAAASVPGIYHRVEAGQTLWRIANTYGIEIGAIVHANRLPDASKLEVGQLLFIPEATATRYTPPAAPSARRGETGDFIWPVRGRIIAYYGSRQAHVANKGIDIEALGQTVVAARAGRVAFVDEQLRGYGGIVVIDHGDGLSTVYTHVSSPLVKPGQWVQQREPIARVSVSVHRTVPYLHFEVRKGHHPQNPMFYLP